MLTPEQITTLRDAASRIADPIQDYLLADIARRISQAGQLTSSAQYQIWRAQQLGMSQRELKKQLRQLLKVSHRQLRQLLTQSAQVGYDYNLSQLPSVQAPPFQENQALQRMVQGALALAQKDFSNIVQTLGMVDPYGNAMPLQQAYRSCMDYAFKQVATGATDYTTAIRQATKHLAQKGVRAIDYESGVHTSLEAATRRSVIGGLGLLQEQLAQQTHDALGCDGWEISAHANSAPDHEPIQGKQYGDAAYLALNASLQRRIGTLNCGHGAFPIMMGVNLPQHTQEELDGFQAANAKGITYQGRHYTGYAATQLQRRLERAIRKQKTQILVDEAGGDKEKLTIDQIRLGRLREEYNRFSKAAGLRTETERTQVAGFGRAEAARAAAAAKANHPEYQRLYELDQARRARLQKHPELALPKAENVILQEDKFTKYLFNPDNPVGYAKGVAFTKRLGYNIDNWEKLREEIVRAASRYPVRQTGDKGHGMTYEQKAILFGRTGKPANVIVAWIEEGGIPRMTSTYIKEVKERDN